MRVLLMLTGGTLLMRPRSDAAVTLAVDDGARSRDLVRELPALGRIAEIETRSLLNMDSADLQPTQWIEIARALHREVSSGAYGGIVVVHGTDTMAYTGSALSLMLGPLPCPVVLTGAQRPLHEPRTDARRNLVDAVEVATMGIPEVQVVFASRSMRAVRVTKKDGWAFEAFESPSCAPLVELGLDVQVGPHARWSKAPLFPLDDRLDTRVLSVRVFPGLDPALVTGALEAGVQGLVLEVYGTGTMPRLEGSLIGALEVARDRGVPALLISQCLRGRVELDRYQGGVEAAAAGAISGGDMTVEAALAKLMIGLARFGHGAELRTWLETDQVGERSG